MNNESRGTLTRPRLTMLLLVVVFSAPFVTAWYLFNFTDIGRGGSDRSHGQLIVPPRALPPAELHDLAGAPTGATLRRKWTLLYLLPESCDDPCRGALYELRQLRLAQGRHADRVQRALVVYGEFPPQLPADAATEYAGQALIPGSAIDGGEPGRHFRVQESDHPLDAGRIYVVDPMGNLMLAYPAGTDPLGIIEDLKRLLRYSGAG